MTGSGFDFSSLIDPIIFPQLVRDLVAEKFLNIQESLLGQLFTLVPNIKYKQQVGRINPDMGLMIGKAQQACGTQVAQKIDLTVNAQTWAPVPYQVELAMCYTDFISNLGAYELLLKTDRSKIDQTQIAAIYAQKVIDGYVLDTLRYVLLSDKSAANYNGSPAGVIKNGISTLYFDKINGVFKLAETEIVSDAKRHTAITADPNSQATYALQDSVFTAQAGADVLRDNYLAADALMRAQDDIITICTDSVFTKYVKYISTIAVGVPITYENYANGVRVAKVGLQTIFVLPQLDRFLLAYQDSGSKVHNPHRVFTYSKSNVQVGFSSANLTPQLETWYHQPTKEVGMRIEDAIDVQFAQTKLIQYAY